MESPFLIDFLKNVGSAVHSINTIIVGLSSVESGNYTKPPDLTITYNTSDEKLSARRARRFALKSALVFIDDALSIYLKDIRVLLENEILVSILSRHNPQFNDALSEEFKKKYPKAYELFNSKNEKASPPTGNAREYRHISSADRIRVLHAFFDFEKPYWIPCIVLLIMWRNKIVHRKSNGQLSREEAELLTNNFETIKAEHANIDISRTISNFRSNEITLKDATTLIAIAIKFVRHIDSKIFLSINRIEIVESHVIRKKLFEEYNSIVNNKNLEIRKRKFSNFVSTNISHITGAEIDTLYESIREIPKGSDGEDEFEE